MKDNSKHEQIQIFLSQSIDIDLIYDLASFCLKETWTKETWTDAESFANDFTNYFNELTFGAFSYYRDATKYLLENDPSLEKSIELAIQNNFKLRKIDSCILANILHQDKMSDELANIDLEEFFNLINQ